MADENQEGAEQAVNSPSSESAPEPNSQAQANPPAGEHPVAPEQTNQEQRVPYNRFHEVVEQKNRERELREEYERKLRDLESRLQGSRPQDHVEQQVKRLTEKLNLSEEAARELVQTSLELARQERKAVEQRMQHYEMQEWNRELASRHKDYGEIVPYMEKSFSSLPPEVQQQIVSSPYALEQFYKATKADVLEQKMQESFNAGANQAYQTKGQKQAVSSVPGKTAQAGPAKLTRKAIEAMSLDEYAKRLPEINAAIEQGLLKD